MRIGSVIITFNETPFTLMLRTMKYGVFQKGIGPVSVRVIVGWLWFCVSYDTKGKDLEFMQKNWEHNPEFRKFIKGKMTEEDASSDENVSVNSSKEIEDVRTYH